MPCQVLAVVTLIGLWFSHYRPKEEIGSGEMGVFSRVRDQHLDRRLAIRFFPSTTLANETDRKHFHKKDMALRKLSHPNIVTSHEFNTHQGSESQVMEYISGTTLSEKLGGGTLPGWTFCPKP